MATEPYSYITFLDCDPMAGAADPVEPGIEVTEGPHVVCFLAGTMIATPDGEVAVEDLRPGDLVMTAQGGVAPVRILAGALGDGLPRRETGLPAPFVNFHVELHDHALIPAEGVEAETFVDNVTRRSFDNWRDYAEVHGIDGPAVNEMDLPRIKAARQVSLELKARLAAPRAA